MTRGRKPRTALTDEQSKALEVVASGGGIAAAAEAAGVTRITLWRWRENRTFAAAFEEARLKASGELLATAQDIVRMALVRVRNIVGVEAEWAQLSRGEQIDFLRFVMSTPFARRIAGDGAVTRSEHRSIETVEWRRAPVMGVSDGMSFVYQPDVLLKSAAAGDDDTAGIDEVEGDGVEMGVADPGSGSAPLPPPAETMDPDTPP